MTGFADNLTDLPPQVDDTQERRRAAFRYANASSALEGLVADDEELALQERVIQGEVTSEEAIALIVAKFKKQP